MWHYVHNQQHTHMSSSYRSSRLGLSHWDSYAMHRGGCLELSYCNMVEWSWWDSSLISKTNWFPSVLWHCWFGHMTCKIVPEMTYNVSSGMLNLYTTYYRGIIEIYNTAENYTHIRVCNFSTLLNNSISSADLSHGQCYEIQKHNVFWQPMLSTLWHTVTKNYWKRKYTKSKLKI